MGAQSANGVQSAQGVAVAGNAQRLGQVGSTMGSGASTAGVARAGGMNVGQGKSTMIWWQYINYEIHYLQPNLVQQCRAEDSWVDPT